MLVEINVFSPIGMILERDDLPRARQDGGFTDASAGWYFCSGFYRPRRASALDLIQNTLFVNLSDRFLVQ